MQIRCLADDFLRHVPRTSFTRDDDTWIQSRVFFWQLATSTQATAWQDSYFEFQFINFKMQETPTDQIVDDATPVLHESGRTFDVIEIGSGMN